MRFPKSGHSLWREEGAPGVLKVVLGKAWSSSLGAKPPPQYPLTHTSHPDGILASRLGVRAEMTGLEESGQLSNTADTEKLDTGRSGP